MKKSRIQRKTSMKRTKILGGPPIDRRRKVRSREETQRVYGGPERIEWLKAQPCVVMGCGRGPCEVAHTQNGGTGRKADACHTVSLCPAHHRELHAIGVRTWESLHRLDLAALAAHTERQWQRHQSDLTPLSRIVPGVVARLRGEREC